MSDNALARLVGQINLNATLVDDGGGDFSPLFPLASQGAEMRMFDSKEELLSGKKEIRGVYIVHRFATIVYPGGYDKDKGAESQADPVAGGAVAFDDPRNELIKTGCAAVQFTKAAERGAKFDFDKTGAGLPRPFIEILIYNADIGGLVVVRPYGHYNAVFGKGRTLSRLLSHAEGGKIPPIPLAFKATVSDGYGKPLAWVDTEKVVDEAYAGVLDTLRTLDDDTNAAIEKWLACEDNPMSDRSVKCLEAATSINPPRF
jgi:hypothetical protein